MGNLRLDPGIGAKKEQELTELGYGSLEALKNADPDELYVRACLKEGVPLRSRVCEGPRAESGKLPLVVFL